MIRRVLPCAFFLAVLGVSDGAVAGDTALAESLFRDGRTLMDAGDYANACPKLAESFAQDPTTGTLLALSLCQEQTGQFASAWANYAEVIARSRRDGRTDREEAAREKMAALESKLSRLTIEVDPSAVSIPGLVIKRDGAPVGKGAWGAASPVDPGQHALEATAPGKLTWQGSVAIGAEADAQTVKVPVLVDDPQAQSGTQAPVHSMTLPVAGDTGAASAGPPLRTIGLVVGGAGLLTLGISGFFGLRAKNLYDESKQNNHCSEDNLCDQTGLAKRDDAVGASTAATVTLIAGGVLTAAGVTLFIVGGRKTSNTARVEATPVMGPSTAAMVVQGRF